MDMFNKKAAARATIHKSKKNFFFFFDKAPYEEFFSPYPTNIYLPKANNRNTRNICEICSKLTIKTPERRH